jgi:hypothetical protein
MGRAALHRQYAQVAFKPLALALALVFSPGARTQDAYAPVTFAPAPPSAAQTSVPPLPFRYVGRLVQNGRAEILLMRGGMLHSVAEGDEIDGEYRVERIRGAAIQFTYLPARVVQTLDLTALR